MVTSLALTPHKAATSGCNIFFKGCLVVTFHKKTFLRLVVNVLGQIWNILDLFTKNTNNVKKDTMYLTKQNEILSHISRSHKQFSQTVTHFYTKIQPHCKKKNILCEQPITKRICIYR